MDRALEFEVLIRLRKKELSNSDISSLFKFSSKIAYKYLSYQYNKIWDKLQIAGYTVEDAAVDSIAELFVKNSINNKYEIQNAFERWETPIEDEASAQFFLNKVVIKKVEQYINKLYRQNDPLFEKLLKSVNYYIAKKGYSKTQYAGKIYIVEDFETKICRQVMTNTEWSSLQGEFFIGKIDKVIDGLFTYIESETNYYPAIPLNEMINKLKKLSETDYENKFYSSENAEVDEKMVISEIVNNGLEKAKSKLESFYVKKGVLTREESESFKLCLNEMADDLKNGGANRGLYQYLENYITNLNRTEFVNRYQNILDYLFWLIKEDIAEELKK